MKDSHSIRVMNNIRNNQLFSHLFLCWCTILVQLNEGKKTSIMKGEDKLLFANFTLFISVCPHCPLISCPQSVANVNNMWLILGGNMGGDIGIYIYVKYFLIQVFSFISIQL